MAQVVSPTIAAVVITKEEERNIAACLASLRWVDEIIVVDACSTDRTAEIARTYTKRVFVRAWPGFGPQRNFAIAQASAEWVLVVDADERVTDTLREEILNVIQAGPPADLAGFEMPRRNFFYGQWIQSGGLYPDYGLRLFRRSAGRYNDDVLLHENVILNGRSARLSSPLDHYSMASVHEHVQKMNRYTTLGALEKLKVRSRITMLNVAGNHLVTALKTFFLRNGYRDGVPGLIVAGFAGMHTFVKYTKAWERLNARSS